MERNSIISINNNMITKFQDLTQQLSLRNIMRLLLILIGYASIILINLYLSDKVSKKKIPKNTF